MEEYFTDKEKEESTALKAYRLFFSNYISEKRYESKYNFGHHKGKLYKRADKADSTWKKCHKREYVSLIYKVLRNAGINSIVNKQGIEDIYYLFMADEFNEIDVEGDKTIKH